MNNSRFLLAAACLGLAADVSAKARPAALESYFKEGWAQAESAALPVPAKAGSGRPRGPMQDMHNPVAHMDITRKAYEVYAAQFGGGELSQYIGMPAEEAPRVQSEDNVVAGSFDEDKAFKNPWNQLFPMANHFWDCRGGFYKGWHDGDSSVNRAHKYWSGGYGIEGRYDDGWESKGAKDEGVLGLYRKGEKAKAYWYLGHVAHLLEDITVPAHALLFTHVGDGTDAYETYMKNHYAEWKPGPQAPIERFDKLYELFYQTANVTNDFDAGSSADSGVDGKKDLGRRRAGGFTEADLKDEGAVLMPLAYRRVAALYLFFFKQLDKNPPKVTLAEPISLGAEATLTAEAVDEQSGVDKKGYRFQVRASDSGAWVDLAPSSTGPRALFRGEPGKSYAFRVSAADAAGNRALSPVKSWTAPGGEALVLAR